MSCTADVLLKNGVLILKPKLPEICHSTEEYTADKNPKQNRKPTEHSRLNSTCYRAGTGRRIAKKWGIDPKAETPAVKYNDGKDYVPTNGWTVFSHQFSSIAGAGPVTGAIQAAVRFRFFAKAKA